MKCLGLLAALTALSYGQLTMNSVASRVFGQRAPVPITSVAPNLVEGRELNAPTSIAFDTSSSPPIMYVADTGNNRVLAWRDPDSLAVCGTATTLTCGAASLVIGQADMYSTLAQGPGAGSTAPLGLSAPTAVAVDPSGNLYVADGVNNRILRFPAPFKQTGPLQVDLVIGQSSVTSGFRANMGQPQASAQTLAFCCTGTQLFRTSLAFDTAGNLWVADPGNNRVLRFPGPNGKSNQLAANTVLPTADTVLGQVDFITSVVSPGASPSTPSTLAAPLAVAVDSTGGLYVLDSFSRVLYFTGTSGAFQNGQPANRILGLAPSTFGSRPNQYSLGLPNQPPPQGMFLIADALFVCDSPAHRVVRYDLPANWPAPTAAVPSPPILTQTGQPDLSSGQANRGQIEPDASTLHAPVSGAALNGEMWIADSSNNRVLGYPASSNSTFVAATRVVGQLDFPFATPNLIEGREVDFSGGRAGFAIDAGSNPPRLYVADSQNNRILGFRDARNVTAGARADIVIGQPDFYRSLINYPSGDSDVPTPTGLHSPTAIVVDAQGNLLVADSGNGRVLRFPSPFSQPSGTVQKPNLVLGQPDLTSAIFDASQQTMSSPFGLALFADGSIAVSDTALNRVLIFARPKSGDFSNGQYASVVLGQPDFASSGRGQSIRALANPTHLGVDAQNRLYLCDTGNSRVLIFTNAETSPNGASSVFQLNGLSFPIGIAVNPTQGDFWVAAANATSMLHYPNYDRLVLLTGNLSDQAVAAAGAVAAQLDSFGNLIAAEDISRVSFFFPVLAYRNTANYNSRPVAPGSLTYVARPGVDFSFTPASATTKDWPTTLANLQVVVNGTLLCPIYLVTSNAVFFQVPSSAPTSGFADFQVIDSVTGQIYADSEVPMAVANPGFYTANAQGTGVAAAINLSDGTANSASNPVLKDGKHYLQFYLTGLGVVPGAPPDGSAPSSPIPAPSPTVFIAQGCVGGFCPDSSIQFSGLAAYPGVWVINFLVPSTSNAGCNNVIAVGYDNILSNVGPNGTVQVSYCAK
jgi:uncharacterized protein (TIGR03437 family)